MSKKIEVVSDNNVFKSSDNPAEEILGMFFGAVTCGASSETEHEVKVRDDGGHEATGRGSSSEDALANAVRNLNS